MKNTNKPKLISKSEALRLKDFSGYPFKNTSLVNLEGEKWVDIPQFDGCFMVSNMGRVKSIPRLIISSDGHKPYYTKERIFSQYLSGTYNNHMKDYTYQLTVHIRYERISYTFNVNRLMYECFVEKINEEKNKIKIIHKDGDNLNNRIENLEKSNGTHIYYNTLRRDRRPLKSKSSQEQNKKAVIQYNLKGEQLNHFSSISDAVEITKFSRNSIKAILLKKHIQLRGFVFRYETDPYHGEYATFSKTKKISQYTKEGELVKSYPSIVEAFHETGINADTISKCALHKSKFARGFVWRYEGDTYDGNFTCRELKVVVCQYSKSGDFLAKFPSITLAAKSIQVKESSVRDCINGHSKTCRGFIWRREDQPYEGEHKNFRKTRAVVKYDREGNILGVFPSMVAAAETIGLTPDAIQKNVKGENHTAGGFVWRYATEEEIGEEPEYITPKPAKTKSINTISVEQYAKNGIKIASYDSITEASEKTGIGMQTIRNFIDNLTHTYGDFIWRRQGDEYKGELENIIRGNDAKTVTQYDLDGNKIKVYASTYLATKAMNYPSSWISQVARGKLKIAHGYIWQYGDGADKIDIEAYWADSKLYIDKTSKSVSCYDLQGNKIGNYKSISEASQEQSISTSKVGAVTNRRHKSTQELIWIYGDGPEKIDSDIYFLKGEIKAVSEI